MKKILEKNVKYNFRKKTQNFKEKKCTIAKQQAETIGIYQYLYFFKTGCKRVDLPNSGRFFHKDCFKCVDCWTEIGLDNEYTIVPSDSRNEERESVEDDEYICRSCFFCRFPQRLCYQCEEVFIQKILLKKFLFFYRNFSFFFYRNSRKVYAIEEKKDLKSLAFSHFSRLVLINNSNSKCLCTRYAHKLNC